MLNVVALVGNLATEPELRYTPNGVAVCNFRLAVQRSFKNREGEREADFFTVVAWRNTAEFCGNYLEKGRAVSVWGRLQARSWETEDGQRRSVVEVVADGVNFVGPKPDSAGQPRDELPEDSFENDGEDVPF